MKNLLKQNENAKQWKEGQKKQLQIKRKQN